MKRSLSRFHPTLLALLLVPGLGPILLVGLLVVIHYTARRGFLPLCGRHRKWRWIHILIASVVSLAGLALCCVPIYDMRLVSLYLVGVVIFFVGLIFGLIFGALKAQVVTLQKTTKTDAWLTNIDPAYLAALPRRPVMGSPIDFEF